MKIGRVTRLIKKIVIIKIVIMTVKEEKYL